jgi:hypothetical protein
MRTRSFDREFIWPKVHLSESSFDRKLFLKMIIWPKVHLTESFFRKMVIWPKGQGPFWNFEKFTLDLSEISLLVCNMLKVYTRPTSASDFFLFHECFFCLVSKVPITEARVQELMLHPPKSKSNQGIDNRSGKYRHFDTRKWADNLDTSIISISRLTTLIRRTDPKNPGIKGGHSLNCYSKSSLLKRETMKLYTPPYPFLP